MITMTTIQLPQIRVTATLSVILCYRPDDLCNGDVEAIHLIDSMACHLSRESRLNESFDQIPNLATIMILLLRAICAIILFRFCELFRWFVAIDANFVFFP